MKSLNDIHLSKNDRLAIEEAANILKTRFDAKDVILFGSKACGADTAESDIDLLVLIPSKPNWIEKNKIRDAIFDLQLKYNVVFNMLIMSWSEWHDGLITVLPIHKEIEKQGVAA